MKKRFGTVLVVGLAALAVLGLVQFWPRPPLDATLSSPDAPPTRLVCYGQVDSRRGPLLLQPARAGRVAEVFVKEGQTVSQDTPLLQLDDRLVQLYEQEATLRVQAAEVQLTKAQNGLNQYQAKQAQAKAALQLAQNKLRMAEHYLTVQQDLVKGGFSLSCARRSRICDFSGVSAR
jgi:multidrug efflux pump subunit AcrA (membrane-fusion protein)